MEKAIAYYRVSTKRQGKSGLGLGAQKLLIGHFAEHKGYNVYREFHEVESGRKNYRPVLDRALEACRVDCATLIIAKLDRLSRNVAFISTLMESKVNFKIADNPNANRFMLHIMAAVAEQEGKSISERTKAALQVAKAKGVELGYNGRHVLSKTNRINADRFAQQMIIPIEWMKRSSITTVRAIKDELNKARIATFQGDGRRWHIASVHALLKRIERIKLEHNTSVEQIKIHL